MSSEDATGTNPLRRFDDDTLLDMFEHAHETSDEHCEAIAAELQCRGIAVKPCEQPHATWSDIAFEDFETNVEAGGKPIPIRITGGALHALWGAGAGPQTAQGIFDEYRPMIDEIVADKILGERVDQGVVVVTGADLDM